MQSSTEMLPVNGRKCCTPATPRLSYMRIADARVSGPVSVCKHDVCKKAVPDLSETWDASWYYYWRFGSIHM